MTGRKSATELGIGFSQFPVRFAAENMNRALGVKIFRDSDNASADFVRREIGRVENAADRLA